MPKATVEEASDYPLPEDTALPSRLESVVDSKRTFIYQSHHKAVINGTQKVGDEGLIHRWKWTFDITGGEYEGLRAWGETEPRVTTGSDDKPRQWIEALRGRAFEVGEGVDTDDVVGLPCLITVRHGEPRAKRDGGMFFPCDVDSVFPADALGVSEPPF